MSADTLGLDFERTLWDGGARIVVGIDEVGRGALAGPVSVGAVALTACEVWPTGLADSKALSPAAREGLVDAIRAFSVASAVGHAGPDEVDAVGITGALRLAALRAFDAIAAAGVVPDAVLMDGSHDWLSAPPADLFTEVEQPRVPPVTMVVKGDARCASIAAASVIAKVERDALMVAAHEQYPAYGWDVNKGYGVPGHLGALRMHGQTPLHRRSWKMPSGLPM